MRIYMATIDHEYGTNFYAGYTPEAVKEQVYEWVTEYWDNLFNEQLMPEDHTETINTYFDHWATLESVEFGDQTLPDPVPNYRDELWSEFAVYYESSETFMGRIDEAIKKMSDNEVVYAVNNFNEVTYNGDAGYDFLDDLLDEFGIDKNDYEDDDV